MNKVNAEISVQLMPDQMATAQPAKKAEGKAAQKEEKRTSKEEKGAGEGKEVKQAQKVRTEGLKKQEEAAMPKIPQRDVREEWEKKLQQNKKGVKKSLKISAAAYMMRLANASTTTAVGGILREARAQQAYVKRSNASKKEIMKALAILKRVIANGNRKISGLKKEQQMENRRRAIKNNAKEALRLSKELKKHRRARRAGEIAAVADCEEVTIHDHDNDWLCPNEFSMNGLIRDLSGSLPGAGINAEVGADTGVCCAAGGEVAAAVDITI